MSSQGMPQIMFLRNLLRKNYHIDKNTRYLVINRLINVTFEPCVIGSQGLV